MSPHIYIISILILAIYSYKFLFPAHSHEESFFAGLKMADTLLPQIHKLPIVGFLGYGFFRIYIYACIFLLVAGFLYFRKKNYLPYLFTIGYCIVFIVIAALAFYKQDAHYAKESRLMPLIFMVVIPLVEILKDSRKNYIYLSGLTIILVLSYTNLVKQVRDLHTKRIRTYERILAEVEQYPERKFYSHQVKGFLSAINSWGMATETILLSSLEGNENSRTIYFFKPEEEMDPALLSPTCRFVWVPWYMYWNESYLNPKYFNLKCTSYREIKNIEIKR